MRDCGTCHPPEDDTPEREVIDRFRDFLQAVPGRPATKADIDAGRARRLTPAERYHLGFLGWRIGQVPS